MTLSRRFTAIAWIASSLITTLGMAVTPWESSRETADYLTTLGTHSTQGQIAAVILHFGFMALVPAYFGLYWQMRDRAGKLGTIGGVLATFGAIGIAGTLVVDFYAIALQHNLPIDQAVKIEEASHASAGAAVIMLSSVFPMILGSLLLVIGAARKGLAPTWAAVALPLSTVIAMTGAPSMAIVSSAIGLAASLGVAHRLMRGERTQSARFEVAPAGA